MPPSRVGSVRQQRLWHVGACPPSTSTWCPVGRSRGAQYPYLILRGTNIISLFLVFVNSNRHLSRPVCSLRSALAEALTCRIAAHEQHLPHEFSQHETHQWRLGDFFKPRPAPSKTAKVSRFCWAGLCHACC